MNTYRERFNLALDLLILDDSFLHAILGVELRIATLVYITETGQESTNVHQLIRAWTCTQERYRIKMIGRLHPFSELSTTWQ